MVSGGLDANEAILRSFWRLSPHGIILLRLEAEGECRLSGARWLLANPAAERLLPGAADFTGLRMADICGKLGDSFTRALGYWDHQLEQREQLSEDVSCMIGGDKVVFHADAVRSGTVVIIWLRDVTDERREFDTLRQNRDLLGTVIHSAPDAIFAKDLQGRYTLINPAGARALGHPAQDIIGSTDPELFSSEDARATLAHDRAVLTSGRPRTYEDEDLGGGRTWQSTKGVLRDARGEITGLFGISRDITSRKRMERSLRASEQRYRLVARATRDVLWDWNIAGNEMRWSCALGEVFGEAPREDEAALGWWKERIHPEDRQRELDALHGLMQGQEDSWSSEYRFRRADGRWATVLERGYVARDREGRPERLIGAMMDVSERKRREEEKAREAELLERFMGVIGHDLGSPMAAIRLASQRMQRAPNLVPEQRAILQLIEESSRRVTRLTQQLLDSVVARQGGIPMKPRPMDLAALCRKVLDELHAVHPQRAISFEVEGETRGQWDLDRLAQAFSNLVGNALEHGAATHPVRVLLRDMDGTQRLEVNNRGVPIPQASIPHLFEPFRRGPGVQERHASGGGVGLGLFIVREIARAHRGDVEVRSCEPEGTTFSLVLPRECGNLAAS